MHTHRFGRKIKLPSTVAIKYAILRLMVQDELKTEALAAKTKDILVVHGREDAKPPGGLMLNLNADKISV